MTYSLNHHPDEATLMSYANGTLKDSLRTLVATHLHFCEACQKEVRLLEELGGALLESVPEVTLSETCLEKALDCYDAIQLEDGSISHQDEHKLSSLPDVKDDILPPTLSRSLGMGVDDIPWHFMAPGIRCYKIPLPSKDQGDLRLLKIKPGHSLPEHGHGGTELTLVLQGAYKDEFGTYTRGDIQDVDDEVEHQPVTIGDEDCICLIAFEQQAHFKGLGPRLLQPFIGM
ncbi:MAG: ChrR family anti-sigma-E factor [Pseudomonadota bacterium]